MIRRLPIALVRIGSWHGPRLQWWFLAAVALIIAVQVARGYHFYASSVLMGSAPNFIAGIGLPAVVLRQRDNLNGRLLRTLRSEAWGVFALCASQGVLLGWEFAQPYIKGMRFDLNDIAATLLGGLAWVVVCNAFPQSENRAA